MADKLDILRLGFIPPNPAGRGTDDGGSWPDAPSLSSPDAILCFCRGGGGDDRGGTLVKGDDNNSDNAR